MEGPARVPRQPGSDFGLFVCGVVVQDDVYRLILRQLSLNRVEEADKLLILVTLHVAADDGAVENIQGSEECPWCRGACNHGSSCRHGPSSWEDPAASYPAPGSDFSHRRRGQSHGQAATRRDRPHREAACHARIIPRQKLIDAILPVTVDDGGERRCQIG